MQVTVQFKRSDAEIAGHKAMFLLAARTMSDVLKSEKFLEHLHREWEDSNVWEGETSIWKSATPEQIYCALQTSQGKIELMIETYHTWKNVIGYGLPNDTVIRVNRKYLDRYQLYDLEDRIAVGSNLLHEHGHDSGFKHDFFATKRRAKSICYSLNRAYERAALEYYEIKPKVFVPKKPWWRIW